MVLEFKDFTYLGKKFSELSKKYISVNFESSDETTFALSKSIEYGDINRHKIEPTVTWTANDNKLTFELHIVKDDCEYTSQADREFTESDIREITKWLTSTDTSNFINFEYDADRADDTHIFYGQFNDIKPFNVNELYGLRLQFECSSSFGYSDLYTTNIACGGELVTKTITNTDDRMNEYCYPTVRIESDVTGQVFFCNTSDCEIYEHAVLSTISQIGLTTKIDAYAKSKGYSVIYPYDNNGELITLCGGRAVEFYYEDTDDIQYKSVAFYSLTTGEYYIVRGGFMHLNINAKLPINIDAEHLFLYDDLNRMIRFDTIGVSDVDYIYFPRLVNGNNKFVVFGDNCTFKITHREARKVGV